MRKLKVETQVRILSNSVRGDNLAITSTRFEFFDIRIAVARRARLYGSDIEICKHISAPLALIAFGSPTCTDFN